MNAASTFFKVCRRRQLQTTTASPSKLPIRSRSITASRRDYTTSPSRRVELETQSSITESATMPPLSPTSSINNPTTQPHRSRTSAPPPNRSPSSPNLKKSAKPPPLAVTRTGTVTAAHLTPLTVRVRTTSLSFDKVLHTHWTLDNEQLVHDPLGLLVEGDVIDFTRFTREERARRVEKRIAANLRSQGKLAFESKKEGEEQADGENDMKGAVMVGKRPKAKGMRKGSGLGRIRGNGRGTVRWVLKQVVTPFGKSWAERVEEKERLGVETAAAAVDAAKASASTSKGTRKEGVVGAKGAEGVAGGASIKKGRKNVKKGAKDA